MSVSQLNTQWTFGLRDSVSPGLDRMQKHFDSANASFNKLDAQTKKIGTTGSAGFAKFGGAAKSAISGIGGQLGGLGGLFSSFAAGPVGIAITAVTLLGTVTAGVLSKGVEKAAQFNHEFRQLANLNLDKSDGQLRGLKKSVLDLSYAEGFRSEATSKAFFDYQSLTGKYGTEVEDSVKKLGRFSQAFQSDFNETVTGGAKAMAIFGFGAEKMDAFLQSSAKAVQTGKTTFEEYFRVAPSFLGFVKAAGQMPDAGNKVFAAATVITKSTEEAAVATKGVFESLTTESVQKAFKKLDVSVFDKATGKARDFDKIIRELVPKFEQMTEAQRAQFIELAGGTDGFKQFMNLVAANGQGIVAAFDQFDKSTVNVDRAYGLMREDSMALWEIQKNRLNVAWIQFGNQIMPIVIKALQFLDGVMKGLSGEWENMTTKQAAVVAGIYTIGTMIGAVVIPPAMAFMGIVEGISAMVDHIVWGFKKATELSRLVFDRKGWQEDRAFEKNAEALQKMREGITPVVMSMQDTAAFKSGNAQGLYETLKAKETEGSLKLGNAFNGLSPTRAIAGIQEILDKQNGNKGFSLMDATKGGGKGIAGLDLGGGGGSGGNKLKGATESVAPGRQVKNITINIRALVDTIHNHFQQASDISSGKLRQMITDELIRAVRDAEAATS